MSRLRSAAAVLVCSALAAGVFLTPGAARPSPPSSPRAAPLSGNPAPLVVHEWGTFTSVAGSDGVNLNFAPTNDDLPGFMYHQDADPNTKANRLYRDGTVSMETPVTYFYTDSPMRVAVKVGFPKGWVTEWYPAASTAPSVRRSPAAGQTIGWDVRLLPGEPVRFPREKGENHYYAARETDAVPLQVETPAPADGPPPDLRGGAVVQREKFLFYRGVGTFPTPVQVRALGGGQVRVKNTGGGRLDGLVLVTVADGRVGFRTLGALEAGAERVAAIPAAGGSKAELADGLVRELTGAGLYEKEARAMVKTWDSAWFGEDGTRLLYLVPRARTEELLPLTIDPKPAEVVRVLVGRHDFLTPEQEADAERQVARVRAAQAELEAAEQQLQKIGRFQGPARAQAEKRLDARIGRR